MYGWQLSKWLYNGIVIDKQLMSEIETSMLNALIKIEQHYKCSMPIFEIQFRKLGRTLGRCGAKYKVDLAKVNPLLLLTLPKRERRRLTWEVDKNRAPVITLNPEYFTDNKTRMLNETIPHEVAHGACEWIYGPDAIGHGPRWREVMTVLGLPANRLACGTDKTNVTTRLRKPRAKDYGYRCKCDRILFLSKTVHNRILQGGIYHCKKCKANLVFAGYKPTPRLAAWQISKSL